MWNRILEFLVTVIMGGSILSMIVIITNLNLVPILFIIAIFLMIGDMARNELRKEYKKIDENLARSCAEVKKE